MKTTNSIRKLRSMPLTAADPSRARKERGIALLMTIFGLLLLTAVAVAMMYSSDSETLISLNYRDKQVATYAALSALQEARARIHPLNGDLATAGLVPTQTPTTSNASVLYIINPNTANGETVNTIAPWKYKIGSVVNPYFDQELCQEKMLGLTGTTGVACSGNSAVPSNSCTGWCSYYDNSSASANATWKLTDTSGNPIPLDYKWVRITLKEDWNTPMYVPSPSSASGQQVCWDGNYQTQIPNNYSTACQTTGGNSVTGLNLTSGGTGYSSAPTVTITGGGGSGATATAVISPSASDGIASVTLTNAGSGYTSPPTVAIAAPSGGTAATLTATVASSAVTGVTVNNSGANYCYGKDGSGNQIVPTVSFSVTPSSDELTKATATVASMNTTAGCISVVSATGNKCVPGSGSASTTSGKSYPITSVSFGGGSGFAGSAIMSNGNKVGNVLVSQVGSGYSSTSSGKFTINDDGGKSCTVSSVTVTPGQTVSSITVGSGGAYETQPSVGLSAPSSGTVASTVLTATPNPWPANASAITAINLVSAGSGYTPGQTYPLTITGGGGSGAVAYATGGGSYVVSGFNLTNAGAGYTSVPTVTLAGGGGSGASATASIGAGSVNQSMGQVYLLTSLAMTRSGSKSMAQMEVGVRPPFIFNLGGAVTLAGPEPLPTGSNPQGCDKKANFSSLTNDTCLFPDSGNFGVSGDDANSCNQTASTAKPAVGVYDNTSQTDVINAINGNNANNNNYIGAGGGAGGTPPAVENVYTAIGGASATPVALNSFVQDMEGNRTSPILTGTTAGGNPVTSLPTTTSSSVTIVNGDLTVSGNPSGQGILIVTGTLTFSGDFTWNGLVLVIGQGQVVKNGGGNGNINGAIYIAKIVDSSGNLLTTVGNPSFQWNGGGTNYIQYDHCKADGLLKKYQGQPSTYPLQVLSQRTLQF